MEKIIDVLNLRKAYIPASKKIFQIHWRSWATGDNLVKSYRS